MWNEKEDRYDIVFWNQQKEEYLQENLTHTNMFAELESEANCNEEEEYGAEDNI